MTSVNGKNTISNERIICNLQRACARDVCVAVTSRRSINISMWYSFSLELTLSKKKHVKSDIC